MKALEATEEEIAAVRGLRWTELCRPAPPSAFGVGPLARELALAAAERLRQGERVGIAVGSRGIAGLAGVVMTVVEAVRGAGAVPVIIPAMGSHGGSTSSGQVGVLAELGVTEAAMGTPVDASMQVAAVGVLSGGYPVYLAQSALACDAVIPVNRVKPHSDFRGKVESGLTKMLAIGLGKERGASSLHRAGFKSFDRVLPEAAGAVLSVLNVPFGVALLEDAWHRLHRAEVVPGEAIVQRDAELLAEAWGLFGTLPYSAVDVLVLKEMGKTVSGAGMDPNVTGRFPVDQLPCPTSVACLVVLDLRDDSGGNAIGVGAADVVTERLHGKVNWAYTYANARASKALAGARLPLVAASDVDAIAVALASLVGENPHQACLVAMANTLEVNHIAVCGPLVEVAQAAGYEVVATDQAGEFGPCGSLARIGGTEFFAHADDGARPGHVDEHRGRTGE